MKSNEDKFSIERVQNLTKKERKILRTKEIILDAAESLFKKRTYEDVRVDDIAEKSALSKATIYNYFHSKEGIYFSIGIRAFHMINAITEELFTTKATGIEILEKLIRANMEGRKDFPLYNEITNRFLLLDQNLATKIVAISRNRREKRLEEVDNKVVLTNYILADYLDQFRVFTRFWKQVILKGVADGTIITNRDIDEISEYIFIVINGIVQLIGSNYLFHDEVVLTEVKAVELTVLFIKNSLGNSKRY
ncbi:MAG: TetR/AcrR family transcriptional regulator [Candidatus Hodarchaeales archaeon]|jgi:AcrR family transcriptional regulator